MTDLIMYNGSLYHAEDFSDDFLAHYGVRGMKWGVRRSRGGYIGKASRAKGNKATKQRTPEQVARRKQIAKRVALGAGAAALAGAAAYGAYKYGGSPNAAMNRYVTGTNAKVAAQRARRNATAVRTLAGSKAASARGRVGAAAGRVGSAARIKRAEFRSSTTNPAMARYMAKSKVKTANQRLKRSASKVGSAAKAKVSPRREKVYKIRSYR